jgi:hypothetical protein
MDTRTSLKSGFMDSQLAGLLQSFRALEMLSFIALYLNVVYQAKPL